MSSRKHNSAPFPLQLMSILDSNESPDIITWLPHGRGFAILNKSRFTAEVMPKYFHDTKYTSFTRRLRRWSFTIQTHGHKKVSYFHPNFIKGNPDLCRAMVPVPQVRKSKKSSTKEDEENSSTQKSTSSSKETNHQVRGRAAFQTTAVAAAASQQQTPTFNPSIYPSGAAYYSNNPTLNPLHGGLQRQGINSAMNHHNLPGLAQNVFNNNRGPIDFLSSSIQSSSSSINNQQRAGQQQHYSAHRALPPPNQQHPYLPRNVQLQHTSPHPFYPSSLSNGAPNLPKSYTDLLFSQQHERDLYLRRQMTLIEHQESRQTQPPNSTNDLRKGTTQPGLPTKGGFPPSTNSSKGTQETVQSGLPSKGCWPPETYGNKGRQEPVQPGLPPKESVPPNNDSSEIMQGSSIAREKQLAPATNIAETKGHNSNEIQERGESTVILSQSAAQAENSPRKPTSK